jgi:hypothetical protein
MERLLTTAALLAGIGLIPYVGVSPVFAQNPQPAPPGIQQHPVAPPNAPSPPPEKIVPKDTPPAQDKTVISPSNVDPSLIKKPPPGHTGTMPVIPPPSTAHPGSDGTTH